MKKTLLRAGIAIAAIALAVFAPSNHITDYVTAHVAAQTTVNSSTLASAQTATAKTASLTSATSVAVGDYLFIDREAELITALSGTTATVIRGQLGTSAAAHASSAVFYNGPPARFYQTDVVGTCTSTSELYLPHINPKTGNVFTCNNSVWQRARLAGIPAYFPTVLSQTYTANGAIDIQPGVVFINGTTLAMTLANPSTDQNGMIMIIESTNASAHTVTYTAGFNGGTTARDLATYGGAIGDNMVIFANSGVWWVISTRNVTFG